MVQFCLTFNKLSMELDDLQDIGKYRRLISVNSRKIVERFSRSSTNMNNSVLYLTATVLKIFPV